MWRKIEDIMGSGYYKYLAVFSVVMFHAMGFTVTGSIVLGFLIFGTPLVVSTLLY